MHISGDGTLSLGTLQWAGGVGLGPRWAGQDNPCTQGPDNPTEKVGTSHKTP